MGQSSVVGAGNKAKASVCFSRDFDARFTLIEDPIDLRIVGAGEEGEL